MVFYITIMAKTHLKPQSPTSTLNSRERERERERECVCVCVCVLYPLIAKISYTFLFKVSQKNFIHFKPIKNEVSYDQS
jgi:hypothetical protein